MRHHDCYKDPDDLDIEDLRLEVEHQRYMHRLRCQHIHPQDPDYIEEDDDDTEAV